MKEKYPQVSSDPAVQKLYEQCRKNGCTHSMADLLSSQKAPRVRNTYSPMHPRAKRGRGF